MSGIPVVGGAGGGVFAEGARGLRRSLTLWRLGIAATVMSCVVSLTVISLPGIGLLVFPVVVAGVRRVANRQRELAAGTGR
ncbi:hypothetical protein [Streptomyces eurocidicus]|uniref:Sensor domain-containing protein n=1 Tax=Streptomyces eurocidicus TaxID=66423 RepID=A0A7W8F390_STREU|nr:hypothetical protein [Streptomyces eurocidicus]MBB5119630.1 hypothetical protein [Streptomyces eurocidicus]